MSTIKGTLKQILPLESGTGQSGKDWKKQVIIVEYKDGEYPKTAAFSMWGASVEKIPAIGSEVEVSYNIESREYNGKWYTDAKGWKSTGGSIGQQKNSGSSDEPPF